jgi:hypothetical protein
VEYKLVPPLVNSVVQADVNSNAYHAFLVVTDTNGDQSYFRGGPDYIPGTPASFLLTATYGAYVPFTPDFTTKPCASQTILSNNLPVQQYIDALTAFSDSVNNSMISYTSATNSNTFVSGAIVDALNLPLPTPPVFVPGWLPALTLPKK